MNTPTKFGVSALALCLAACGGNNGNGSSSTPQESSSTSVNSSSSVSSSISSSSSSSIISSSSSSSSSVPTGSDRLVYAINVGGGEVNANGITYKADAFGSGGNQNAVTEDIGGTAEDALYQSERYGEFTYEIPVTNATYDVKLNFAELYVDTAGARVFNLSIEGQNYLMNMDLFNEAGKFEAVDMAFTGIAVNDEYLTITTTAVEENPTLSGIALFSETGEWREPPPPPVFPERPGADCNVPNLPSSGSLPNVSGLPDPFRSLDGSRITSKEQWKCRREETLQQAYTYIYGEKPTKPTSVTGTVTNNQIRVNVSENGRSTSFTAGLNMPSGGTGLRGAMIGYAGFGSGIPAEMQAILDQYGIATISYDAYSLGAENGGSAPGSGAFYDIYGSDHPAGLLTAWAWGISRIIDVLEADGTKIDTSRIGVTGCSRFGKGPFIAAAFDARIALAIPVESGIGGVPALKMVPQLDGAGEQPSHAINYQPWLSPSRFRTFASNLGRLPVDTHQVIGLIAPRGLLVIDNPGIGNLDPASAYGATEAGQKIYEALGFGSNVGYVGAGGNHCQWRSQYTAPTRSFIAKFLAGDDSAQTGSFSTSGSRPNLNSWIDWTTPSLSGQLD